VLIGAEQQLDINKSQAIDLILGGLDENYANVEAVTGVWKYTRKDSPAMQATIRKLIEEKEVNAADAVESGYKQGVASLDEQYSIRRQKFTIRGSQLRFEGSFFDPRRVIVLDGSRYLEFYHTGDYSQLTIKDRHFEVQDYRDPRELFYDASMQLKEVLLSSNVLEASTNTKLNGKQALVVKFVSDHNELMILVCDIQMNYLPKLLIQTDANPDFVQYSTEVDYQSVGKSDSRFSFPQSVKFKYWGQKSKAISDFTNLAKGWSQSFLYEVENLNFDPVLADDAFELSPYDGTLVVDDINDEQYTYPRQSIEMPAGSQRVWWQSTWTTAFLLTVVIILAYKVYQRRVIL